MKLSELKTPFCRRKIITYASDHTTAVVKNREIQQIDGYLYKGNNEADAYGQVTCRIYLFYPEIDIGIDVGGLTYPDERTAEDLSCRLSSLLGGPQSFIDSLDRAVTACRHIGNAQIELARHIAPEKVDTYIEARQRYRDMLDRQYEEERKKQEAEDEAFCKEKNEEAQKQIDKAIETIRSGGKLDADFISIYRSRYNCRSYNIINHLARMYGVEIPLKVQGWINSKLHQVTITGGRAVSMRHSGRASKTFWGYMDQLIETICQEKESKRTAA